MKPVDFWTCGFFPGSLYALSERINLHPLSLASTVENGATLTALRGCLEKLGRAWSDPIHGEARLTNTHDLGFIMMPHMRRRWEMYHDQAALDTIITAACSLYTRFDARPAAIRSWDEMVWTKEGHVTGMDENFIVIIDSMCNLELLYYAAAHSCQAHLARAATAHARKLLRSHLRPESKSHRRQGYSGTLYSTHHMVVFDTQTGVIKQRRTCQGYSDSSTWARGQAWAILGFAQTYLWTGCAEFLDAACGLAQYFLHRMETSPPEVEVAVTSPDTGQSGTSGRYVPLWDFDAPLPDDGVPIRDTSAATCAANGMLVIAEGLQRNGRYEAAGEYIEYGKLIIRDTLALSLAGERAQLVANSAGGLTGADVIQGLRFDGILKNATVANNGMCCQRLYDHGLVYADYFLLEFGNRLLRMGLA
ncbi:Six-hairpin glycosidase-like protein [Plectosphaerella plurivora]|uniref:Six-hairpin glycosidase-like protein n=1 Tax=Plectosphaerella plurivora TaxID=936078 RepID=A0A9P9AEG9_9PEZI|nr:Six-hairpin glycosidase-like protein [Plectosphaerella plurivora]